MEQITSEQAQSWFDHTRDLTKLSKYKPIAHQIRQQTLFLSDSASMPQRLWHVIHQTDQVPKCKTCKKQVSWDRKYKQYKRFCGNSYCYGKDPDVIKKKKQNTDYRQSVKKQKQTNLMRYGHTNYLASDEGKRTVKRAFGEQSNEQKQQRYQKVKQTREQTLTLKYGVTNISMLNLTDEAQQKLNDRSWLYQQHYQLRKPLSEIAHDLNIKGGSCTVGTYLRRHGLITRQYFVSTGEKQIRSLLESYNIQFETNVKNLIPPKEVDIYIPEHKLAIEFCGLYWHSEQAGRDQWYHYNKWRRCKDLGIDLLTIYSDEWEKRQSQVTNKILHRLNHDQHQTIYARNTTVSEISSQQSNCFLEQHHIQGKGKGSVKYGLFHDQLLIGVGVFVVQQNNVILNRYATSKRIVGGLSKMLAHAVKEHNWKTIVSFADLRYGTGKMYESCGFTKEQTIPPDYYYSPDGHTRFHKFNYRRKHLPKRLSYFDPRLSERQNCDDNNILRIWDCGKIRYVKHYNK